MINNSTDEKLMCIKFDSKLSFEKLVSSPCVTASQKLNALIKIVNYMDLSKQKIFAVSYFRYYSLVV